MKKICVLVTISIVAFGFDVNAQSDSSEEWQTDCVGRMQLSFPGEIVVASTSLDDLKRKSRERIPAFPDGEPAPWTTLIYGGSIEVIHGMSSDAIENYMDQRLAIRDQFRADATKTKKVGKPSEPFRDLFLQGQHGVAFEAQGRKLLFLHVGDSVFSWEGYTGVLEQQAEHDYLAVLNGIRARKLMTSPKEEGVCIPYGIIRDNGSMRRAIRLTYRLTRHPDITILLQDASAATHPNKEVLTAKYRTNDFWGQYSGGKKEFKSAWWPVARDVTLAGQKGMQTFVQFIREDGNQDYGYLAVAPGDPNSKEDVPDLMLYVMREAKNAIAKGIEPMDKGAFIEMAKAIAASVKRRPVSQ